MVIAQISVPRLSMPIKKKILILGAGPCGLGAAWRLQERGFQDFLILEASDHAGGLASSFVDSKGFTWDTGGHVQFSHYEDFDRVMDLVLPNQWLNHQRESWIWIFNRFIPYPFQNNLWRLPEEIQNECILALENLSNNWLSQPANFKDWILQSFGEGIARIFMLPYNFKVWAYPPEDMSYQWIGERVATIDLKRVKENICQKKDDISWGPNSTFRFPLKGGTGAIWKSVASFIQPAKIKLNTFVVAIDRDRSEVTLSTGEKIEYESLLSTLPLTKLAEISKFNLKGNLLSSDSNIVGIGIEGEIPEFLKTKCWMYFPESDVPFYRVTVFSNYSPHNVPDPKIHWSLMVEVSSSIKKPENIDTVIEDSIAGLKKIGFILPHEKIVSKWQYSACPGYPTPSLNRDEIVDHALNELSQSKIYSRGRFGAWKYEVSNQDHTFMQGFEWADWYTKGIPEVTAFSSSEANAPGKRPLRPF